MKSFLLVFMLFCMACSKDSAPLEIPLNIKTPDANCGCIPSMDAYLYYGRVVYLKTHSGPACSWFPVYYDANGNQIWKEHQMKLSEFLHHSIYFTNIWRCG